MVHKHGRIHHPHVDNSEAREIVLTRLVGTVEGCRSIQSTAWIDGYIMTWFLCQNVVPVFSVKVMQIDISIQEFTNVI